MDQPVVIRRKSSFDMQERVVSLFSFFFLAEVLEVMLEFADTGRKAENAS